MPVYVGLSIAHSWVNLFSPESGAGYPKTEAAVSEATLSPLVPHAWSGQPFPDRSKCKRDVGSRRQSSLGPSWGLVGTQVYVDPVLRAVWGTGMFTRRPSVQSQPCCCIFLTQDHGHRVQVPLNTCSPVLCLFLQLPHILAPRTVCLIPLCHTPADFCLQPVGFCVTAQLSDLLCESLSAPQSTVPLGSPTSRPAQAGFSSMSCSVLGCRDSSGQRANIGGQKNKPEKWGLELQTRLKRCGVRSMSWQRGDPPLLDLWRPCSCRTWNRDQRDHGTELGRTFESSNGVITDMCYFILEHAILGDHALTS